MISTRRFSKMKTIICGAMHMGNVCERDKNVVHEGGKK